MPREILPYVCLSTDLLAVNQGFLSYFNGTNCKDSMIVRPGPVAYDPKEGIHTFQGDIGRIFLGFGGNKDNPPLQEDDIVRGKRHLREMQDWLQSVYPGAVSEQESAQKKIAESWCQQIGGLLFCMTFSYFEVNLFPQLTEGVDYRFYNVCKDIYLDVCVEDLKFKRMDERALVTVGFIPGRISATVKLTEGGFKFIEGGASNKILERILKGECVPIIDENIQAAALEECENAKVQALPPAAAAASALLPLRDVAEEFAAGGSGMLCPTVPPEVAQASGSGSASAPPAEIPRAEAAPLTAEQTRALDLLTEELKQYIIDRTNERSQSGHEYYARWLFGSRFGFPAKAKIAAAHKLIARINNARVIFSPAELAVLNQGNLGKLAAKVQAVYNGAPHNVDHPSLKK